jgi:hypothetical protein
VVKLRMIIRCLVNTNFRAQFPPVFPRSTPICVKMFLRDFMTLDNDGALRVSWWGVNELKRARGRTRLGRRLCSRIGQ